MGHREPRRQEGSRKEKQRDYHRVEVGVRGERTGKPKKTEERGQRPAVRDAASEREEGSRVGVGVGVGEIAGQKWGRIDGALPAVERERMKQGRGERVRVGSKAHRGAMTPGWVDLEGQQDDPGSGSAELQRCGAGMALSP